METKKNFQPRHINAHADDLAGNQGIGRYILMPGSDGRAQVIADHFSDVIVQKHSRGHHLYLGTIKHLNQTIDVATVASGMGCPSMEIILHELFHLGAKRFLRLGTAGSLQPNKVNIGDIINVQAAVRDEQTTLDYAPKEVPAIASFDLVSAVLQASLHHKCFGELHTGIVHCKSSFYAREFLAGPCAESNKRYIQLLQDCGVLATEMETASLFLQSQIYNHELQQMGFGHAFRVLCGAILGVIAIPHVAQASENEGNQTINDLISLGLETIKIIATTIDVEVPAIDCDGAVA